MSFINFGDDSLLTSFPKTIFQQIPRTIDELKSCYLEQLESRVADGREFDLHGLPYASVKFLLENFKFTPNEKYKMICGRASHNNHEGNPLKDFVITHSKDRLRFLDSDIGSLNLMGIQEDIDTHG